MNGVILVLTDLSQTVATLQSLRMTSGDCVFALAKRRRLLRFVPSNEDYDQAWQDAKKRVVQGKEPAGFTSVLAVAGQDRRASEILGMTHVE